MVVDNEESILDALKGMAYQGRAVKVKSNSRPLTVTKGTLSFGGSSESFNVSNSDLTFGYDEVVALIDRTDIILGD